jgi:hypothetical protein
MTDKPPKHDMDLIEMVQRARMKNDDQAQPSQISAVYWIEAKAPNPQLTPRAGALVIATQVNSVDDLWAQVKAATEAGDLGYKAKVSTAPGRDQGMASDRLIHVRVADGTDAADLQRVRAKLHQLGITGEVPFVPDQPAQG